MSDAWRSSRFDSQEQEPLGPLANLIDIMLVFACGLIAALVALSPELGQHFNVNAEQSVTQSRAHLNKQKQPVISVGKELPTAPQSLKNKLQSEEGYESMGQVYKDPKTGKLILISND